MASMPPAVPNDEWEVEEGEEALPADPTDGEGICPCVAVASWFPDCDDPGDNLIRIGALLFSIGACNSGGGVRGVPVVNECC